MKYETPDNLKPIIKKILWKSFISFLKRLFKKSKIKIDC